MMKTEMFCGGQASGRAVLTATANKQTATAVVSVVSGNKLPPGIVRWSLQRCRI